MLELLDYYSRNILYQPLKFINIFTIQDHIHFYPNPLINNLIMANDRSQSTHLITQYPSQGYPPDLPTFPFLSTSPTSPCKWELPAKRRVRGWHSTKPSSCYTCIEIYVLMWNRWSLFLAVYGCETTQRKDGIRLIHMSDTK